MLPREIQVESDYQSARYTLPMRPLGKIRFIGLAFIGFGMLFMSVPLGMLARTGKDIQSSAGGFAWLFVLFTIPFFLAGLLPIGIGLMALCGRCRIEWRDKRLSVVEMAGPLRWRRRIADPKRMVRRFKAATAKTARQNAPIPGFGALMAEFDDEKKNKIMIAGYPQEWLLALAQDLSGRIGVDAVTGTAPKVEVE